MNYKQTPQTDQVKPLSNTELRLFKLKKEGAQFKETLEDLRAFPPNFVTFYPKRKVSFRTQDGDLCTLEKKRKYVSVLGLYQKLSRSGNMKVLIPAEPSFVSLYRPYNGEDIGNETKRFLFLRSSGYGDISWICSMMSYMKDKYPNSYMIFAAMSKYHDMIKDYDFIDELITLPFSVKYLLNTDYHMILEGVAERCGEANRRNCYHVLRDWFSLKDMPDNKLIPPEIPIREENKDLVFGILKSWKKFEWLEENKSVKSITCQIRASALIRSPSKVLFWKPLINSLNRLGYTIIVTDSPHQNKEIDSFIKTLDLPEMNFNFSGFSKSVDLTITLASISAMVISVDSMLVHVSASLKKPILGIYTSFPGKIRMETYKEINGNADWVENLNYKCAPCFSHQYLPCPHHNPDKSPKCFDTIPISTILEKVKTLYNKPSKQMV